MNQTLPQIAAVPRQQVLDGRDPVALHPLTVADFAAWDAWARAEFLKSALAAVATMPDQTNARLAYATAMRESATISFGSGAAIYQMDSVAGKLKAVGLSMRAEPDVALAALGGATPEGYANLQRAFNGVLVITGLAKERGPKDGAGPTPLIQAVETLNPTA